MRTRTPFDRNDLKIGKYDKVLEVGSGNNPMYRSNVLCEKFIFNNYHRSGDIKIYSHQTLVHGDAENFPFDKGEFDYTICNQVLEHADDPVKFINEICRVSRRGYIETPSLLGEFLFPKQSHKWVILDIDDKLVLYEKSKMKGNYLNNYGELFLNYLPYISIPYRLLWFTDGDIMLNRYEWKDNIDFIVNPEDEYYLSYFIKPWTREMVQKLYPKRTILKEGLTTFNAALYLVKQEIKTKLIYRKRHLLSLGEYEACIK